MAIHPLDSCWRTLDLISPVHHMIFFKISVAKIQCHTELMLVFWRIFTNSSNNSTFNAHESCRHKTRHLHHHHHHQSAGQITAGLGACREVNNILNLRTLQMYTRVYLEIQIKKSHHLNSQILLIYA